VTKIEEIYWGREAAGGKHVKREINGENFSRNPIFIAA